MWHGSLQNDARALVIILKVGSVLARRPEYLFEKCFEGLDVDQVTHPVTKDGIGHHRWLEGPMQHVWQLDRASLVTTILQRILEFVKFGFEEVKDHQKVEVLQSKDQFLELGLSTGANIIANQGHQEVVPLLPKAKSSLPESSFSNGCLREDALALVLVLKKGTLVQGGPMFLFEGCYEGLNEKQLTHRVIKNGDGHHRWLEGPLKLVQRKDMGAYVTTAVHKVLKFIGLGC
ncbi:hypothetical protein KC19_5G095800 [Ceratodon purpureus]|uniref:Uncharacterized protein n=1 Tax=Ceratodon purpureus TaxID=3225 RepID=A0A8T0I121_CERPU|nr:hypothetical protein KC19_5G095800 [Ceratodon purpureus]